MSPTEADALDRVFRALADRTRRSIFTTLGKHPGSTTSELAATIPQLSRWAVMKHLEVLRQAGLVQTLPRGRERCHFRVEETLSAAAGWLQASDGGSRGMRD